MDELIEITGHSEGLEVSLPRGARNIEIVMDYQQNPTDGQVQLTAVASPVLGGVKSRVISRAYRLDQGYRLSDAAPPSTRSRGRVPTKEPSNCCCTSDWRDS